MPVDLEFWKMENLLAADIKAAAKILGLSEIRYLVDYYYLSQKMRTRAGNQLSALEKSGEPHSLIYWLKARSHGLEQNVKRILAAWVQQAGPLAEWCLAQKGIGPVITAGLMAHIDITKAPTVGHIWRFAGLDPTVTWKKNQKRPWNASLKVVCWKAGESFVKVCNNPDAFYGHLYQQRKILENQKNDRREFADQAAFKLKNYNIGKDTKAHQFYSQGLLPPDHIHQRAKRYAVKLFLSHYHEVAYELHYGKKPPLPYPIAILGHAHQLAAPG